MYIHYLFPQYCPVCEQPVTDALICIKCEPKLFAFNSTYLPGTRTPLLTCGSYARQEFRVLIHAGKFLGEQSLLRYTAMRAAQYDKVKNYLQDTFVTPVPLHPKRLAYRGYNQSEILTIEIQRTLNLPAARLLTRSGSATPQSHKKANQKQTADFRFSCIPSALPKNTRITLVDDVCTSGATFTLAVQSLRRAGYMQVQCFALCRG